MILGVDPGLHGALVIYDPASRRIADARNLPVLEIIRNRKSRTVVDIHTLARWVDTYRGRVTHAFLELVGPMPKQGVSSVWSFARADTAVETCLICNNIPLDRVPPPLWKKALGVTTDGDQILLRASQLMPADAARWQPSRGVLNKQDALGIAEAALIALYGARRLFGLDGR